MQILKSSQFIEYEEIKLLECKTKVTRKNPFVPDSANNIDNCTLYLNSEHFPPYIDHDSIRNTFENLGEIVNVSFPKFNSDRVKVFVKFFS